MCETGLVDLEQKRSSQQPPHVENELQCTAVPVKACLEYHQRRLWGVLKGVFDWGLSLKAS